MARKSDETDWLFLLLYVVVVYYVLTRINKIEPFISRIKDEVIFIAIILFILVIIVFWKECKNNGGRGI